MIVYNNSLVKEHARNKNLGASLFGEHVNKESIVLHENGPLWWEKREHSNTAYVITIRALSCYFSIYLIVPIHESYLLSNTMEHNLELGTKLIQKLCSFLYETKWRQKIFVLFVPWVNEKLWNILAWNQKRTISYFL